MHCIIYHLLEWHQLEIWGFSQDFKIMSQKMFVWCRRPTKLRQARLEKLSKLINRKRQSLHEGCATTFDWKIESNRTSIDKGMLRDNPEVIGLCQFCMSLFLTDIPEKAATLASIRKKLSFETVLLTVFSLSLASQSCHEINIAHHSHRERCANTSRQEGTKLLKSKLTQRAKRAKLWKQKLMSSRDMHCIDVSTLICEISVKNLRFKGGENLETVKTLRRIKMNVWKHDRHKKGKALHFQAKLNDTNYHNQSRSWRWKGIAMKKIKRQESPHVRLLN